MQTAERVCAAETSVRLQKRLAASTDPSFGTQQPKSKDVLVDLFGASRGLAKVQLHADPTMLAPCRRRSPTRKPSPSRLSPGPRASELRVRFPAGHFQAPRSSRRVLGSRRRLVLPTDAGFPIQAATCWRGPACPRARSRCPSRIPRGALLSVAGERVLALQWNSVRRGSIVSRADAC